jgi:hypothetical protein
LYLFIVAIAVVLLACQNQALDKRVQEQESSMAALAGAILPERASPIETSPSQVNGLRHRNDGSIGTSHRALNFNSFEFFRAITIIRLKAIEDKLQCVSTDSDADDLIFRGCNVHLENGSGTTLSGGNGKGNFVIGYNEEAACGGAGQCERGGSHNLVLGVSNAYSASGGIVSGSDNTIDVDLAILLGGEGNSAVASGVGAVIAGGKDNVVSGLDAVVDGGAFNDASNTNALVSGGFRNNASGVYSVAAGGLENDASGPTSVTAGGRNNEASGIFSFAAGGSRNKASGFLSVNAGGRFNDASGQFSAVFGGTP